MDFLAVLVSTFGYVGFFPIAPGTVGSMAGIGVYLLLQWMGITSLEPFVIVVLFAAGTAVGARAERHFRCVDPGPVVIDEVMGMLITLLWIPVGWGGLVLGFVLFRVLDIVKPFPSRRLERLPGGLGMMADDAMAAIYANLLVRAAWRLFPGGVA